jgi:VWFA-related protein
MINEIKRFFPGVFMKKVFLSLSLLFLFSLNGLAQAPTPTPTPKPAEEDNDIVKISTALIQIDVTVTDKDGKVITDLKPEEFEVYENSQKQTITNFSFISSGPQIQEPPTPKPEKSKEKNVVPLPPVPVKPEQIRRTLALVVDDLGLSYESMYFVRRSLKKFVDEQMQPNDLVAIIRTGSGSGALQQFTSDKRQLLAVIDSLKWNAIGRAGIGAFAPVEPGIDSNSTLGGNLETSGVDLSGTADQERDDYFAIGTLGAINFVVKGMNELPGRKSIMLFSDGFIVCPPDQIPDRCPRIMDAMKSLTDLSNRAAVTIYSIDARGLATTGFTAADSFGGRPDQAQSTLSTRSAELFNKQDGLAYLARETGGRSFFNNNDFNKSIDRALEDQKGFYLIGYQPDTETFDAERRRFNKLDIKIKRPGASVRYRSGFFGVEDRKVLPTQKTPTQQILTALSSPFAASGIELHLNTLFGKDEKIGAFVQSFLHVDAKELKFSDTPDGWKQAVFDIIAVNYGTNGVVADQISRTHTLKIKGNTYDRFYKEGFVYNFFFPVKKAGAYQMRVAIRDAGNEKVGSASQFIEVPNIKKQKAVLSGIVLENFSAEAWKKHEQGSTEQLTDPQTDTSLRRFKKGSVLRYGIDIYNAKLDAAQKPNLMTQVRVFREGKLILDGKPKPLGQGRQLNPSKINFMGALNLGAEIPPGDYVLQIIVTDTLAKEKNRLSTQWIQFEVTE